MDFQEIAGEEYRIYYDPESGTVTFQGELRLGSIEEYEPIVQFLERIANQAPHLITLNMKPLEFLNSSGISLISKFLIGIRKKKNIQIAIVGSNDIAWQEKSLKNLERLLPTLELRLE